MHGMKPPFMVGSITGDASPDSRLWMQSCVNLNGRVGDLEFEPVPIWLDIVLHIDGTTYSPEFVGIRTGSLLKQKTIQVVQVAIHEKELPDKDTAVRIAVARCVEVAEAKLRSRKLVEELSEARRIATILLNDVGRAWPT
jgi:hypothetical protein